ncbi:MAG TPA: hypothetical protein VE825_01380 [Terriglobales bacterium]|jgi:hypothetical protein|nr:hypothetical protein [Terriglobales bacterium]
MGAGESQGVGRILLMVAAIFLIIVGGLAGLAYRFFHHLPKPEPVPVVLQNPRVEQGAGRFRKTSFWRDEQFGLITAMEQQPTNTFLILAGQGGARFLKANGESQRSISWEEMSRGTRVKIIPLAGDSVGFLVLSGPVEGQVSFVDSAGKPRWSYTPDRFKGDFVDDAAAADFRGNGRVEFAIGYGGGGGVRLLDAANRQVWHQPDGNVWHIESMQDATTGKRYVVHSNASGELVVVDGSGNVISSAQPASGYLSDFAITNWKEERQERLVACGDNAAFVFGLEGRAIAQLPAQHCNYLWEPQATPVHFTRGRESFAFLAAHGYWGRSVLYIFDDQNRLQYQEILGEECGALAVVAEGDHQKLMVGCEDEVWQYEPTSSVR